MIQECVHNSGMACPCRCICALVMPQARTLRAWSAQCNEMQSDGCISTPYTHSTALACIDVVFGNRVLVFVQLGQTQQRFLDMIYEQDHTIDRIDNNMDIV